MNYMYLENSQLWNNDKVVYINFLTSLPHRGVLAGLGDLMSQWLVQVGQPGRRRVQWRSVAAVSVFGYVLPMQCSQ